MYRKKKLLLRALAILALVAPLLLAVGFCYFLYTAYTYKNHHGMHGQTHPRSNEPGVMGKVGQDAPHQHPTVAVVFTGAAGRIPHALDLQKHGHLKEVFISGVNKSVAAKDLAALHHVSMADAQDITLGHNAENTLENVQETKEWLLKNKVTQFYLITSYYHMPRSLWLLRRSLPTTIDILPWPTETTTQTTFLGNGPHHAHGNAQDHSLEGWLKQAKIMVLEYGKIVKTPFQLIFVGLRG